MEFPGFVRLSTGGDLRTDLKKEIGNKLVTRGLSARRKGYHHIHSIDADLCVQIIADVFEIESRYKGDAIVKELWISSGYYVHVHIRRS